MKIFLADLGHNQLTLSSDVYPLGIANLAAYIQAYSELAKAPMIKIFREPEELYEALSEDFPDLLGLSNYAWNHELSLHFARHVKRKSPNVLTVMGGPNFPLTAEGRKNYLKIKPEIDAVVCGPTYEGERAFLNTIKRFSEVKHSVKAFHEEPLSGNVWIDRKTEELIQGEEVKRINDLDEIPSPYLTGWMETFLKSGYFPIMQITRGCPFSCAYCCSSLKANNKPTKHSIENIQADLLYLANRINPEIPLCFADDNFGMYPWDEEVADFIAYLQKKFNWPRYIRTTTGKNKYRRIIRVARKIGGILPLTAAVQSLNPVVLKNIKRTNISLESFSKLQKEILTQGMQSYGELILCLPGESKHSFIDAIDKLLDLGVQRISAHQLMLLDGSPLSTKASRKQWGFETRFRVVARNIGKYIDEPVVEVEEIVVETPTLSFDDYLGIRVFHLLLTIFYYEGNYEEAFQYANQEGVKPSALIAELQSMLDQAPARFKSLIGDFVRESKEELFQTKEECIDWAHRNFEGLLNGSTGGNLLSKYSMEGRFFWAQESMDFMEAGITSLFTQSSLKLTLDKLRAVMDYLRAVLLHAPFLKTLASEPTWRTLYNIEAWRADGYTKALDAYRYPKPQMFHTTVEPERKELIESRIRTFGEHPAGLGKFTRTMFAKDLRRTLLSNKAIKE
jgi:radical SAM superfamily enzyme YgiQ (UPF0313 family)